MRPVCFADDIACRHFMSVPMVAIREERFLVENPRAMPAKLPKTRLLRSISDEWQTAEYLCRYGWAEKIFWFSLFLRLIVICMSNFCGMLDHWLLGHSKMPLAWVSKYRPKTNMPEHVHLGDSFGMQKCTALCTVSSCYRPKSNVGLRRKMTQWVRNYDC